MQDKQHVLGLSFAILMSKKPSLRRTLQPLILIVSLASLLCLAIGCASPASSPAPMPTVDRRIAGDLPDEVAATLNSREKVDGYPLYVMHYYGDYSPKVSSGARADLTGLPQPVRSQTSPPSVWACSLFVAPGQADHGLYGRNFDSMFSPAVLLFTAPPDGYASVSMVDIAYLGFEGSNAGRLTDLPLQERQALLNAPLIPFDGMNEYGLAVGLAAVPLGKAPSDPAKETISSLRAIREMLDHARTVDEAAALLRSYNIDMLGGQPIHYLIADAAGRSALVEFVAGEMVVIANKNAWHLATNHSYAAGDETGNSGCWRYDKIYRRFTETGGRLSTPDALDLLAGVSQEDTQWSVVYGMKTGDVSVVMGRKYSAVHAFHLPLAGR